MFHYITEGSFAFYNSLYILGEPIDSEDANRAFNQLRESDMEMGNLLGTGSIGEVYHVTFKKGPFRGHKYAAAKKLNKVPEEEVDILKRVKHTNVVQLLAYIDERFINLIVMELADQSLRKFLNDNQGDVPQQLLEKWVREVCDAIEYLHGGVEMSDGVIVPVVHRDIKASNCLLFGKVPLTQLKIADFSISRQIDHTEGM